MAFDYIKSEAKRLASISFLLVGFFLIVEHIWTYGYISLGDILGHEWLGILLFIIGILIARRPWDTEKHGTILTYAFSKLKALFGRK